MTETIPSCVVTMNLSRIECDAWIDRITAPDGGWTLIGMGRRTEYDAIAGAVISNKVEPTGVRGWAPYGVFGESRRSWWQRLLGDRGIR